MRSELKLKNDTDFIRENHVFFGRKVDVLFLKWCNKVIHIACLKRYLVFFMCHHSRTYIIEKTREEKKIDILNKKTFFTLLLILNYPLKTKYLSKERINLSEL